MSNHDCIRISFNTEQNEELRKYFNTQDDFFMSTEMHKKLFENRPKTKHLYHPIKKKSKYRR